METTTRFERRPLPLQTLNHLSLVCSDPSKYVLFSMHGFIPSRSLRFYRDVLGFVEVRRPSSFDFSGHWLFHGGTGLHLIQGQPVKRASYINPKADHFSFQSDSVELVVTLLNEMDIPFLTQEVVEDAITVKQVFFHDPDHNMIEVCNCDCLPLIEISREQNYRTNNSECVSEESQDVFSTSSSDE